MGGEKQSPTLSVCRASLISFANPRKSLPSRSASANRPRRPRFCCFSHRFPASFTLLILPPFSGLLHLANKQPSASFKQLGRHKDTNSPRLSMTDFRAGGTSVHSERGLSTLESRISTCFCSCSSAS